MPGGDPHRFRAYWKRACGPVIATCAYNAHDADRVAQLDRDLLAFLSEWHDDGRYEAEYLLLTARVR